MKHSSDRLFKYLVPEAPASTDGPPDPSEPREKTTAGYKKLVQQFAKVMAISDKYQAESAEAANELRQSKKELERTQETLRESEKQFRALSDNLPVGVAMIGARMDVLAVNSKMEEWFPDVKTKPYVSRNSTACPVLNALQDGRTHSMEQEITTRLGHRHFHISAIPVNDAEGQVGAVIEMAEDITVRKQTEAEMKEIEARDRYHQKTESLGRMAAAIAHHFNNQLQSVMGNLELAMEDLSGDERSMNRLNNAMQAARRAAEVSALMRAYLGEESVILEPIDLSEVCRENLPALTNAIPKGYSLQTDLPESGPIINGKAGQIAQVLISLASNAWEAMEDKGEGVVRLKLTTVSPGDIPQRHRFPIDWQPDDSAFCCLEVIDTGNGIDRADLDKIFDPFFSNKFTGRGLGLSVVLGMVRAHNGGIIVESEPGKGSTFRCFFPLVEEKPAHKPSPTADRPSAKTGGTVLLVEDEKGVRTMSAQMLEYIGFDVLEAEDGSKAVQLFREQKDSIACVLCDMSMPHMNGWETLAALREISPDIPVVLSSGYDESYVMAGEHAELPQDFISKPYDIEHLKNAINRALADRKDR